MIVSQLKYKVMDKDLELRKIQSLTNDLCYFAQILRKQKVSFLTSDSNKDIYKYQYLETKQVISNILNQI